MGKVTDKDQGYAALVKSIYKLSGSTVSVGFFDDGTLHAGDRDGLTILELATIHEYGLGVPERSFLRSWFDANDQKCRDEMAKIMQSVIKKNGTADQALARFGNWAAGQVKLHIAAGISPPLAASTIARKGSSTPLIDTGQLRSSVTFRSKLGG